MKLTAVLIMIGMSLVFYIAPVFALPDQYPGDTSIYGVSTALQPNVLIVLDNSGSMSGTVPGGPFDPNYNYDQLTVCKNSGSTWVPCVNNSVYIYSSGAVSSKLVDSISSITCAAAKSALQTSGTWTGKLTSSYGCGGSTNKTYETGRLVNYMNSPDEGPLVAKSVVATRVIENIIKNSPNIKFGLMTFYNSNAKQAPPNGTTSVTGGGALISYTFNGGTYTTGVQKMDTPFPTSSSTKTNKDALFYALETADTGCTDGMGKPCIDFSGGVGTRDGQMLLEAGRYFGNCDNATTPGNCGEAAWGSTVGVSGSPAKYTTPVEATCQSNYVILITDGMSTDDDQGTAVNPNASSSSLLGTICPTARTAAEIAAGVTVAHSASCASDGCNSSSSCPTWTNGGNWSTGTHPGLNNATSKVAQFLNRSQQHIVTYTVGFGLGGGDTDAVNMLNIAADSSHGKGAPYLAGSEQALYRSLTQAMADIYEKDSAFVAPVVPVSPQNRTYGANRVYIGFFKPMTGLPWEGNLKKYGLDSNVNILDSSSPPAYATWVDDVAPTGQDDRDNATVPSNTLSGTFRSGAISYWNNDADGGSVAAGGAGEKLQSISTANLQTSRTIYTMASTSSTSLIALNSITDPTLFGYDSSDTTSRDNLISFLYGKDVYDDNGTGGTTDSRSWFLGDVLHSRPLVLNYNSYPLANEGNCSGTNPNKSMIYVGSNDGMLHAFKDCDGSEAWAFVPPDLLTNLDQIHTSVGHPYFVDSSVTSYVYNNGNTGTISTGDKVIIVFGERRGGGTAAASTTGAYYALDVSNPSSPSFLWTISNTYPTVSSTPVFPELGESWSEPKIVKMKIGTAIKIVAFIGAGYDNPNEDGRYGATQYFQGIGTGVAGSETGAGTATSNSGATVTPALASPYYVSPKGRGIYAVEIATLNGAGVPAVASSANKIWGFTYGNTTTSTATGKTDPSVVYSFPSQLVAIDSNNTGYTDRIYGADTGGNLWRFSVGNSDSTNWTGSKIFSANPGYNNSNTWDTAIIGRKVFYPPAVVSQSGYKMIFFGTGDREHPLNKNVVDRFYAVKDDGTSSGLTESNLVDVTDDALQTTDTSTTAGQTALNTLLSTLGSSKGWFIRLNQNAGEKILAAPTVFNKVAYFTTYYPNASGSAGSCSYDLGTAQLYAVNYLNGAAVFNYDTGNGSNSTNKYAKDSSGNNLLASDRTLSIGTGIPSGVVVVIDPGGNTEGLVSAGGTIQKKDVIKGGTIIPLYWRQK